MHLKKRETRIKKPTERTCYAFKKANNILDEAYITPPLIKTNNTISTAFKFPLPTNIRLHMYSY